MPCRMLWKWVVPLAGTFSLPLPTEYRIVHCGLDPHGNGCVWALVDPMSPVEPRRFFLVGTGYEVPDAAGGHVGTFVQGDFVWHVFAEAADK